LHEVPKMGINGRRMRTKWNLLAFLTVCAAGAILSTPRSARADMTIACCDGANLCCCGSSCGVDQNGNAWCKP